VRRQQQGLEAGHFQAAQGLQHLLLLVDWWVNSSSCANGVARLPLGQQATGTLVPKVCEVVLCPVACSLW
jgi:hypothetical protein